MIRFEFKNQSIDFTPARYLIFAILNVTPDSFSDGGKFNHPETALQQALTLENEGADFIDVGGESTRPNAPLISEHEEINRVLPVIKLLTQHLKIPISIDTTKASVAQAALEAGASIINDVSALSDSHMITLAAKSRAGLILMHRRGNAQIMQSFCQYQNLISDIQQELFIPYQKALENGVIPEQIVFDPGIGFSKTREQNRELLNLLPQFCLTSPFSERPLMIGLSRKSFLGDSLQERFSQTLSAELQAVKNGAHMIRTHAPAPLKLAIKNLSPTISI